MNPRRVSKAINIGGVTIGGDAPIVVQSMTKTDTQDIMSTITQIKELEDYGFDACLSLALDESRLSGLIAELIGVAQQLVASNPGLIR